MRSRKAAPPKPRQRLGARGNISIADRSSPIANPSSESPQAVSIRAELVGSDCCSALGIAVYRPAPVLALCKLVEAGYKSATPLEVWRRETLALIVRSIDEGSGLRIGTHGVGFEGLSGCTASPPVEETAQGYGRDPQRVGVLRWGRTHEIGPVPRRQAADKRKNTPVLR
jgi:hypothetical protein